MKVVFKILEYLPETDQIVVNFCRQNAPKPVDEHKPLVIDCKHIDMTDKVNLIESLTQLLTPHIYRRESEEPTLPENVGGEMFFPETIEVLDKLKERYSLHIITNGFREVQQFKMRNAGLTPYFNTVTDSESVGVKKPNPLIFRKALTQADCDPTSSVMIGDSYEADIVGALQVGMNAIHFMPLVKKHSQEYQEIENISQLNFLF